MMQIMWDRNPHLGYQSEWRWDRYIGTPPCPLHHYVHILYLVYRAANKLNEPHPLYSRFPNVKIKMPDTATTTTKRGLVSYGPYNTGGWKLQNLTLRPLEQRELLVEIVASGICQTDLHLAGAESGFGVHYPRIMGHEGISPHPQRPRDKS